MLRDFGCPRDGGIFIKSPTGGGGGGGGAWRGDFGKNHGPLEIFF